MNEKDTYAEKIKFVSYSMLIVDFFYVMCKEPKGHKI